jgi:hypothetical protein
LQIVPAVLQVAPTSPNDSATHVGGVLVVSHAAPALQLDVGEHVCPIADAVLQEPQADSAPPSCG